MPPQCFGSPGLRHRGLGGWSKKRKPLQFVFDFENQGIFRFVTKLVFFYEIESFLLHIIQAELRNLLLLLREWMYRLKGKYLLYPDGGAGGFWPCQDFFCRFDSVPKPIKYCQKGLKTNERESSDLNQSLFLVLMCVKCYWLFAIIFSLPNFI